MGNAHLLTATRKPLDLTLTAREGSFPDDWYGTVFINSGAGTVNSGGLPYPETLPDGSPNPEYGSPVINGDGYVMRWGLSPGKLTLKSRLLQPPCYYADTASADPSKPWHDLKFNNMGIARISLSIGTRNQLNTAFQPFRLRGSNQVRLLATFDAGRPYEIDPSTLELITPIGPNAFWLDGTPPFFHAPCGMVLTTAHPVFDPATNELFSVNFTKTTRQLLSATRLFDILSLEPADLEALFIRILDAVEHEDIEATAEKINALLYECEKRFGNSPLTRLWNRLNECYYDAVGKCYTDPDAVWLIKWDGEKYPQKWRVVSETGAPLRINHNMHQLGLTRNYVILCDTNFKFTLDVMLNNPFPANAKMDAVLRRLLSGPMQDYSSLYFVERKDLKPGVKKVRAQRMVLPIETVHFSADYNDDGGTVRIHTAHNSSSCPAEWIRFYDRKQTDGKAVDRQRVGLIAVGPMDVGKIGRVVVNVPRQKIEKETDFLVLPGNPGQKSPYPHTWAVGLYTYRDMCSPTTNVEKITHVYWQAYGASEAMLTQYIYQLYRSKRRNRTFSPEQVEMFTRAGAPFVLQCVETEGMQVLDWYGFGKDEFFWSLQFVPKAGKTGGREGYVFCTTIVKSEEGWQPEIWVFDGENLAAGPVAKASHPELNFAFTIHSVWVETADSVPVPPYVWPVREDYDPAIAKIPDENLRARIQSLFNQEVYPRF